MLFAFRRQELLAIESLRFEAVSLPFCISIYPSRLVVLLKRMNFSCGQDLFLTPGEPEEQDPSTGHYSACSESGYCLIYDNKGLIIQHSQQH